MSILLAVLLSGVGSTAQAETGKKALILGPTVDGGASSPEATEAIADGFTVTIVDATTWGAMTAADFSDYQLVVVGDPDCEDLPRIVSKNASALADAVMARAGGNTKVGNRILIGTDPDYHYYQGGSDLIKTGIDFAGATDGATNLYLDFSCYDPDWDENGIPDGQDLLLPKLSSAATPTWTQNQDPPCGGSVSLISNAAQFSGLTTATLQGWDCSVHETFPVYPTDWTPLAIATDTATAPTCGSDVDTGETKCGEAYLLIAGSGIVATSPDLKLTPLTAVNPVGTTHTVTATVTNPTDSMPRSGVLVSFVVTGANDGAVGTCAPADCTTPANGQVTFTYSGMVEGDDTINASITVDGSTQTATAAKTWVVSGSGGPSCNGKPATIIGTGGADTINGTGGNDVIVSKGGNDTINAGLGNDTVCAGAGTDKVRGGGGDEFVNGGAGNDTITGDGGNDKLQGGLGDDVIFGSDGNDGLYGGAGNDTLSGGLGNDLVSGGTGDDKLTGGSGDDHANGFDGNDRLFGNDGNDLLQGGTGTDRMDGGAGAADTCNGGADAAVDTATATCETDVAIP